MSRSHMMYYVQIQKQNDIIFKIGGNARSQTGLHCSSRNTDGHLFAVQCKCAKFAANKRLPLGTNFSLE